MENHGWSRGLPISGNPPHDESVEDRMNQYPRSMIIMIILKSRAMTRWICGCFERETQVWATVNMTFEWWIGMGIFHCQVGVAELAKQPWKLPFSLGKLPCSVPSFVGKQTISLGLSELCIHIWYVHLFHWTNNSKYLVVDKKLKVSTSYQKVSP